MNENNYPELKYTYEDYCLMAQSGDKLSTDFLCKRNRNFIIKMCRQSFALCDCPEEVDFKDMYQEGYIGFLEAIKTFKLDKGVKFLTYAGECVKNRTIDYIKKAVIEKQKKFPVLTLRYEKDTDGPGILYNPADEDVDEKFYDSIPKEFLAADESFFIKNNTDITKAALETLDGRHREYIDYRFGTSAEEYGIEHTREETAKHFKLNLNEASKIENETKTILKDTLFSLYTFIENNNNFCISIRADKFSSDTRFICIYFKLVQENNSSTECEYEFTISAKYKENISDILDIDFENDIYSIRHYENLNNSSKKFVEKVSGVIANSLRFNYKNCGPLPNGIIFIPESIKA